MSEAPQNSLIKTMFSSAGKLTLFVFISIILLLIVREVTAPVIAKAEKQNLLNTFNQVLPTSLYDNNPLEDQTTINDSALLKLLGTKEPVTVYRAYQQQRPAGVIFSATATNGYSGNIVLLIGITASGEIAGVRVLKHAETPGLGDKIELSKDDWILSFNGLSLSAENQNDWAVKKDNGQFDQFTGATITPRAVVGAVKNALTVVNSLQGKLYE